MKHLFKTIVAFALVAVVLANSSASVTATTNQNVTETASVNDADTDLGRGTDMWYYGGLTNGKPLGYYTSTKSTSKIGFQVWGSGDNVLAIIRLTDHTGNSFTFSAVGNGTYSTQSYVNTIPAGRCTFTVIQVTGGTARDLRVRFI